MILKPAQSIEEIAESEPLGEFLVWWDDICEEHVEGFSRALDAAVSERQVQDYLRQNPKVLVQHLGGGQRRWVIPQKRLGAEYVPDFLLGERNSIGCEWYAVELESPRVNMFTKRGDPTAALTHAIRQIEDWRAWLQRNQNYAARPCTEGGLGLTDIVASVRGLVLIGRREDIDPATRERRRQMVNDLGIQIHSYDFLLEAARGRLMAVSGRCPMKGAGLETT